MRPTSLRRVQVSARSPLLRAFFYSTANANARKVFTHRFVSAQLQLPRTPIKLDDSIIQRPKDLLRAFIIAADLGGLDDKQAAAAAGMDPSTWSQFKAGDRGVKPLELNAFLDQCGNELPLAYWAWARGYTLTPMETELEKRLRLERERADKAEERVKLLTGLLTGKTGT